MRCAKLKTNPGSQNSTRSIAISAIPPVAERDLPQPGCKYWSGRLKARVVAAVESGLITRSEACRRYAMSVEEYLTWKDALQRFGINGLQVSRAQSVWNMTPH